MKAWHFVGKTLRDGRPVPADGKKLIHTGELVPCQSGLHASVRLIDALQYAPGDILCLVEIGGKTIRQKDKLVASERTIIWRIDAGKLLREFACKCALDATHLWKAPDVVALYLKTRDESLRKEAADAAADAAYASASASAYAAADAASASASAYAAADAAYASAAAYAAADAAAYAYAANAAAYAAADAVAYAAANAANAAAYARKDIREKQNRRFVRMVMAERQEQANGRQ